MSTLHVVTVDNSTENAKRLIATVLKDLQNKYSLVHIANCENITHVKDVLKSLIVPPQLIITTSSWFEDEQEEIREIVQRILPDTLLITIPPGLKAQEGENNAEAYLADQISESKLPTSTGGSGLPGLPTS